MNGIKTQSFIKFGLVRFATETATVSEICRAFSIKWIILRIWESTVFGFRRYIRLLMPISAMTFQITRA